MSEVTFINGMIAKRQDNAPDFVLCNLSIKVEELIQFLQQHQNNGWVNIDVKRSKQGKVFAALNTWKPTNQGGQVANNGGQQNVGYQQQPTNSFDQSFPPQGDNNQMGTDIPF